MIRLLRSRRKSPTYMFESMFLSGTPKLGAGCLMMLALVLELALMVEAGLTPIQAITVATSNSAGLLRIGDQYGTLAAGKKANFIVLEKDPSQDIHNTQTIRAIWKDGNKVSDGPLAAGTSAMLR